MKRFLLCALAVMGMFWSLVSQAGDIGVVDMQKVFASSQQVKDITAELKSKFSDRQKALQSQAQTLQADMDKLNRNKSVMSAKEAQELTDKVAKSNEKMQAEQAQFQKDLFAAQNDAMNSFMGKLNGAVAKVAEKRKLDMVLPKNGVVYSSATLDVTDDVVQTLKK